MAARGSGGVRNNYIVSIHGMRIVQLTARLGSVMTVSESDSLSAFDPVLNAFRVLGQLYNLAVSGEVAVVPEDSYADSLVTRATEESSDLLLLPWTETGSLSEAPMVSKNTIERKLRSGAYSDFVTEAIDGYRGASAVFVNKNFSGSLEQSPSALTQRLYAKAGRRGNITEMPAVDRSHHIFMPFFGGADGETAVRLTLQLALNPELTVTMVHYQLRKEDNASEEPPPPTIRTLPEGKIRVSSTDDDSDAFFVAIQQSLPDSLHARVTFRTSISFDPVSDAVADTVNEVGRNSFNGGDLVILGRNIPIANVHASRCLGLMADLLLEQDVSASVVIVQARRGERRGSC
jgi:hypothetical protein